MCIAWRKSWSSRTPKVFVAWCRSVWVVVMETVILICSCLSAVRLVIHSCPPQSAPLQAAAVGLNQSPDLRDNHCSAWGLEAKAQACGQPERMLGRWKTAGGKNGVLPAGAQQQWPVTGQMRRNGRLRWHHDREKRSGRIENTREREREREGGRERERVCQTLRGGNGRDIEKCVAVAKATIK